MRKLYPAVLIALACLVIASSLRSIRADPPVFEDIDETFVDDILSTFCGFPVEVHLQGKLINTLQGNTVLTRGAGYTVTYTNLDTGQYFQYQVAGLQAISDTVDGTIETLTISFSGNVIHLIVPGQGDLVHQAGQVVDTITIDLTTGEGTITETVKGTQKGALTDDLICELLSS
jgi:hypothetical protein